MSVRERARYLRPADRRLGRHVNHDPRSRRFPVRVDTPIASVRWERRVAVWNQGSLGSCTGNAGLGCLGADPFYSRMPAGWNTRLFPWTEDGAVNLYAAATAADAYAGTYPPTDTGSDGLSIAKVLLYLGAIAGYEHAFGLEQALKGLMTRPAIVGIEWTSGMWEPNSDGVVRPTGTVEGGHEIVMDEYDVQRGLVGFTNSWGALWGVHGRFYLSDGDFAALLARQGDVTFFTPLDAPAPEPLPEPAPAPTVDESDREFWEGMRPWATNQAATSSRRARRRVREWAAQKGLSDV